MTFRPNTASPLVLENNAPIFAWAFVVLWTLILTVITAEAVRDGSMSVWSKVGLGAFWMVGLAMSVLLLWLPRTRVEVTREKVVVQEKFLWATRERHFAPSALSVSEIEENSDEGTSYACWLVLP